MNYIKLNYDDVTIIPERLTDITSRKECNPYDKDGFLPIFASCMSSVVSVENIKDFCDAKIRVVVPRSYHVQERLDLLKKLSYCFVAFSLKEAQEAGLQLIDLQPRKGAENLMIAFLHPKSTCGVLTELCEQPK